MIIQTYIQSYIPVASLGGDTTMGGIIGPNPDWVNGRLIGYSGNEEGIRIFDVQSGAESGAKTITALTGGAASAWDALCGIDRFGNMYFGGGAVFAPLLKVTPNSLALNYSYGSISAFGPPGTQGVCAQAAMVIGAKVDWLVST